MGIGQSVPLAEFYAVSGGLRGAARIPNVNLRPISRRGAAMKRFTSLAIVFLSVGPLAAQPNFELPKAVSIDAETLKKIEGKIEDLKVALDGLPRTLAAGIREDVEVYHKAAVWMVRHGEYFAKDTAKQTLAVLDAGLERARHAAKGEAPWLEITGKPVIRGYRSRIDGSIQPYSVVLPTDYIKKRGTWRIDIVLHGRNQTLTEVSFIRSKETAKAAQPTDRITIEVYGRGNNAYRWAGEEDVHEAFADVAGRDAVRTDKGWLFTSSPRFLRGFSMGGAGTWHIGLHHPSMFRAISPGAGFTTTHGYIKNLPKLPDYQERCLTIYDAVNYAENAFNVPVIAYSGEKDPQKAAADNIENALKTFKEPLNFQHIVAPGLEHKQPPEWLAKIEAEFAKIEAKPKPTTPERVRFVTYTLRYPECKWVRIEGLERHYDRASVDAVPKDDNLTVTTKNVSRITLRHEFAKKIVIDGQTVPESNSRTFAKESGKWTAAKPHDTVLRKRPGLQGPIDDVFHTPFHVVGPTKSGWIDDHAKASLARFGYEWDKYFRSMLPTKVHGKQSVLLFGDPASNPEIAAVLPKLPITWTAEKLVVNGVEYDPKTHVPVLIYPHPAVKGKYVVLNSGHTFRAADLKGTNALLYPRLGDWAVLKPNPTKADPAAADVVAAGIFNENWQFEK